MGERLGPPVALEAGSLAAARYHVQSLGGGDREALLHVLLEQGLFHDRPPPPPPPPPPPKPAASCPSSAATNEPIKPSQASPESSCCGPSPRKQRPALVSVANVAKASTSEETAASSRVSPTRAFFSRLSRPRRTSAPCPTPAALPEPGACGSSCTSALAEKAGNHNYNHNSRVAASGSGSGSGSGGAGSTRAYWCTWCGQKIAHKSAWKRHEEELHERPLQYPCPEEGCHRLFYSAASFGAHHQSAHGRCCTAATCPHATAVARSTHPPARRKRAWGCGFCAALLGSLERYHEHVALHFESGKTPAHWRHAYVIYGLLHQPGLLEASRARQAAKFTLLSAASQGKPLVSWLPDDTGRAVGFREGKAAGKLQDLLESYDPRRDNAGQLAETADKLAVYLVGRRGRQGDKGVHVLLDEFADGASTASTAVEYVFGH